MLYVLVCQCHGDPASVNAMSEHRERIEDYVRKNIFPGYENTPISTLNRMLEHGYIYQDEDSEGEDKYGIHYSIVEVDQNKVWL